MADKISDTDELKAWDSDIHTIDATLAHKKAETTHLIEEARLTPTENETRLAQEHKALQESMQKMQAERDAIQKRHDEFVKAVNERRLTLRQTLQKHGIPFASIVALLLIIGIGAGAIVFGRTTTPASVQVASKEPAAPGFPLRSAA